MKTMSKQAGFRAGYSLGEMLAAMVIGAMVLTAILGVYSRANRAAEAVLNKIETPVLAAEVLQLIARDLDRALGAEDIAVQVRNGFDNGFVTAQLILRRTVRDSQNKEQLLEEIVWRAAYDYDSAIPGMVLYRSHEGVGLEDKLLDAKRKDLESLYPLVPVCRGVTYFKIEVPKGVGFVDRWSDATLPTGVRVTLSFAEPYETVRGTQDVQEYQKTSRTIAIDRTRAIRFAVASGGDGEEDLESEERTDETPARSTTRRR
jgi:hypothetical protein